MNKTAFSPLSSTPTGPTRPAHTLSGFFLDVAGYEIKEMPLAVLALREQEGIGIAAWHLRVTQAPCCPSGRQCMSQPHPFLASYPTKEEILIMPLEFKGQWGMFPSCLVQFSSFYAQTIQLFFQWQKLFLGLPVSLSGSFMC